MKRINAIKSSISDCTSAYYALLYAIFYCTPWTVSQMHKLEGASTMFNGIAIDEDTRKFKVFEIQGNGKMKIY